jgi:TfoX/Sxy family transcriptional regulator of competence genes
MPRSLLAIHLFSVLSDASAELPEVTQKYMFGADALFAASAIYALVWDGRIAVKLPAGEDFEALWKLGADPWSPMKSKPMSGWLLVPEELHDDLDGLRVWVERAHRHAFAAGMAKQAKARTKAKAGKAKGTRAKPPKARLAKGTTKRGRAR